MPADHEVVLAAFLQNGMALQYASDELKADPEVSWRRSPSIHNI